MDLPRPLLPWRPYLALFPRQLALSLGPVLQRLASAVGPLPSQRRQHQGEIDGFDGLGRRGSYERLLASEWLLADEAPEEFLRRASQGEHLFFELARPEPQGGRLSVAAFDAGPNQLGGPRIAQLALLIVLARRAEDSGVRFGWGILQEPAGPLFPTVTEAGVLRLLEARTAREATAADLAAWNERLGGWEELDDLWLVGGPRLAALPRLGRASRIEIRDPLDPAGHRLAIRVHAGGGAGASAAAGRRAEVELELPPADDGARLLRDPFAAASPGPGRVGAALAPLSNLVFAGNGARFFARSAAGIVAYPVPSSPRAGAPPTWSFPLPAAEQLIGVGFARREVILATAHGGQVSLHSAHKNGGVHHGGSFAAAADEAFAVPAGDGPLAPCFRIGELTFLADGHGALFELTRTYGRVMWRLAARVSAWAHYPAGVALLKPARAGEAGAIYRVGPPVGKGVRSQLQLLARLDGEEGRGEEAFFGFGGKGLTHALFGLLATARDDGRWAVLFSQGRHLLDVPAGARVVGVGRSPRHQQPGLVVIEDDRRTLAFVGRQGRRVLATAAAEIEDAAASHGGPHVAWRTDREVAVLSLDTEAVLCRWLAEEER